MTVSVCTLMAALLAATEWPADRGAQDAPARVDAGRLLDRWGLFRWPAAYAQSTSGELPEGWSHRDIGSVRVPGSAAYVSGAFAIASSGKDVWRTSDRFHFVYQRRSGDLDVVARLVSTEYRDQAMKAGVMIRGTLDPRSPHAFIFLSADGRLEFRSRREPEGDTAQTLGSVGALPAWLKIERRGAALAGYSSEDGTNWMFIGSAAIEMPESVFVGLAVASGDTRRLATAVFDRVILPGAVAEDAPPPPPNAAPTLLRPGDQSGRVGQAAALQLIGVDPDGDPLTYATVGLPPGLVLNEGSGLIAGTPAAAGAYAVKARVSDGVLIDRRSFTWTIEAAIAPGPTPRYAVFEPSADHDRSVDHYVLEVAAAATPAATLVQQNLGKPAVVNGECRVEITSLLAALPAGDYIARLKAVGAAGSSPFTVSNSFPW